jgi:hypothetical protein
MTIAPEVLKHFSELDIIPEEPKLEFELRTITKNGKTTTYEYIKKGKRGSYKKDLKETFENTNRDFDDDVNTDLFWTEEDEKLQQQRIEEQGKRSK